MHCRLAFDISWSRLMWAAFGPATAGEADIAALTTQTQVTGLSVRTLFDAVLAEAGLNAGAPVLMSGVNIENMHDIVRLHGLVPHAVDIAADTLRPDGDALLDAQARSGARLCLTAHLFGARGTDPCAAELRRRGVLVVHDMAQAFSRDCLDAPLDADVALLSFGPIKRRTALGGAIARFRDPDLAARVRARLETYPALSDAWFRRRARKYLLLKTLSRPMPYGAIFRLVQGLGHDPDTVFGGLARGFAGDDLLRNIRHRPPARLRHLLARQIADDTGLPRRQAICRDFLAALPPGLSPGHATDDHVHWLVPVLAPDPASVIATLRRHGFDATRGATSLRALTGPDSDARRMMEHIVYLPHPADMTAAARRKLRDAVKAALAISLDPSP